MHRGGYAEVFDRPLRRLSGASPHRVRDELHIGQFRDIRGLVRRNAAAMTSAAIASSTGWEVTGFHRFQRPRTIRAGVRMLLDGGGRWRRRSPRSRSAYAVKTWPAPN